MPKSRQLLVGAFVLSGILLFGAGLFLIGDRRLLFSRSLSLSADFTNLGGLKSGARVMVAGMEAGEVLDTHIPARPGEKFRVHFRVLEKFKPILRTDSVASIQVEGLVGSKVLQVEAGTESGAPVAEGSTIRSREPMEIADVIEQTVETIKKMNAAVDDVQGRVVKAVDTVTDVGEKTRNLVVEVAGDVDQVMTTSKRAASSVNAIIEGVRDGRGSVGKLLNDDGFYERARGAVAHMEATAANARKTSDGVRAIVADLESRNLGEKAEKAFDNVQEVTASAKTAMAGLLPPGGKSSGTPGPMEELRATLANTREATSDLADNMEALKRNWFFRGFFKRRGFYDLNTLSPADYLSGKVAPDRARERAWVHRSELFTVEDSGVEVISNQGKTALDKALAPYLRHVPNMPLVVEGYAAHGDGPELFLRSRDRARLVRHYLIERFGLNAKYVGVVPMGGVASAGPDGKLWDGVAVVWFPEKQRR